MEAGQLELSVTVDLLYQRFGVCPTANYDKFFVHDRLRDLDLRQEDAGIVFLSLYFIDME
jgi:hypothetical protein